MLIYVCSSSHGFGHAARDAAVLQQLRILRPDWRLVMSSAINPRFLGTLLGDGAILQRRCRWDVGVVQADALGSDPAATLGALDQLERDLPDLVRREVCWIRAQREPVLVLGDIPPAAAQLAAGVGAPLVWMSNFGWDDIYRPFGPAFQRPVEQARAAYASGCCLLRCPFDLPMDWGLPEQRLGLVCSQPRPLPQDLQDRLTASDRPRVQVGFGGMGLTLSPRLFAHWPGVQFLMAAPVDPDERAALEPVANLQLLPEGVRPLDAFPYCDRHLGKPGFSTFSEALASSVGLHVVERRDFAEVEALIQGLRSHGHHRLLTRNQLEIGDWQLDQPLVAPTAQRLGSDGARQAALALLRLAEQLAD